MSGLAAEWNVDHHPTFGEWSIASNDVMTSMRQHQIIANVVQERHPDVEPSVVTSIVDDTLTTWEQANIYQDQSLGPSAIVGLRTVLFFSHI